MMNSLVGFPRWTEDGFGSWEIRMVDGIDCCVPKNYTNISVLKKELLKLPSVNGTTDIKFRSKTITNEAVSVYINVEDSLLKRLTNTWYKHGFVEALKVTAESPNVGDGSALRQCAIHLLDVINSLQRFRYIFQPHLKDVGPNMVAKYSKTRNWSHSKFRCIAWHPHTTKLAIALDDDNVAVYSSSADNVQMEQSHIKAILKSSFQKSVSSMAWRPYCASELAIGCEAGVVLWTLDPNSMFIKPSPGNSAILQRSGHSPVTSVEWSPQGNLLISSSPADSSIILWDVCGKGYPLKQVSGGGTTFTSWSPDGARMFSATAGVVFRMWECSQRWNCERWCSREGRVKAACWVGCSATGRPGGQVLVFAADAEPLLYALRFSQTNLFAGEKDIPNKAQMVMDLSAIDDVEGIGGPVLDLQSDVTGQHLAILFDHMPSVALFTVTLGVKLQVTPFCSVTGEDDEVASAIAFNDNFSLGTCLTVAWSSGRIQHFPIILH